MSFDLLALTDLEIMSQKDARGLLTDVATTHGEAAAASLTPEMHRAVVEIVGRILAGRNGVRPWPTLPRSPDARSMSSASLRVRQQAMHGVAETLQ